MTVPARLAPPLYTVEGAVRQNLWLQKIPCHSMARFFVAKNRACTPCFLGGEKNMLRKRISARMAGMDPALTTLFCTLGFTPVDAAACTPSAWAWLLSELRGIV